MNAGNGLCQYLDAASQRCSIYENRPLICRVDDLYQERLAHSMTPRAYYLLQAEACVGLDPANAAMPAATAKLLAQEAGGEAPPPLSREELAEGLRQVLQAAGELVDAG